MREAIDRAVDCQYGRLHVEAEGLDASLDVVLGCRQVELSVAESIPLPKDDLWADLATRKLFAHEACDQAAIWHETNR